MWFQDIKFLYALSGLCSFFLQPLIKLTVHFHPKASPELNLILEAQRDGRYTLQGSIWWTESCRTFKTTVNAVAPPSICLFERKHWPPFCTCTITPKRIFLYLAPIKRCWKELNTKSGSNWLSPHSLKMESANNANGFLVRYLLY